jgi:hypothetical protein
MSKCSSVLEEVNGLEHVVHDSNESSLKEQEEKDKIDDVHSFITDSHSNLRDIAPPPVAPRRSRQNSTCSTQSSAQYAS